MGQDGSVQRAFTRDSGPSTRDHLARLPHTYPVLLVDRVLMIEPGQWAVGLTNASWDDALVDGAGILPPTIVGEVMAQTAGLAVAVDGAGQRPVLVQIDRFRCRPPVSAGERLLVIAHVLRRFGGNVKVRVSVSVAGRRRAAGELVLHFPPISS